MIDKLRQAANAAELRAESAEGAARVDRENSRRLRWLAEVGEREAQAKLRCDDARQTLSIISDDLSNLLRRQSNARAALDETGSEWRAARRLFKHLMVEHPTSACRICAEAWEAAK